MYGNIYVVKTTNFSVAAAPKTAVQILAGATAPVKLLRAVVSVRAVTASAMVQVGIYRKSAAATVTAAIKGTTLFDTTGGNVTPAMTLSTAGTGVNATVEGTNTDAIVDDDFNVVSGWEKVWTPLEQIIVPAAGIVGLIITGIPATTAVDAFLVVQELG